MLLVEIRDYYENFGKYYIKDVSVLPKAISKFVEDVLEGRLDSSIPVGRLEVSIEDVEVIE